MEFKIKHENPVILHSMLIAFIASFIVLFVTVPIAAVGEIMENTPLKSILVLAPLVSMGICDLVAAIFLILYFVEAAKKTTVTMQDDGFHIRGILLKKFISYSDIAAVSYAKYFRTIKAKGIDYRSKITISLKSGKDVVLTDSANAPPTSFVTFFIKERLPDSEVALYDVFSIIKTYIQI